MKGYALGIQSRYQHCVYKLAVDAVIIDVKVTTDILVYFSKRISASLLDKVAIFGKEKRQQRSLKRFYAWLS